MLELIIILLEIFDKITCLAALCVGVVIIPYSIYNCGLWIMNKGRCLINKIRR